MARGPKQSTRQPATKFAHLQKKMQKAKSRPKPTGNKKKYIVDPENWTAG
jgi:hypothetical protein